MRQNGRKFLLCLLLVAFFGFGTAYAAEKGTGGASTVARKGELALGTDVGIGGAPIERFAIGVMASLSYHVIDNLGLTFRFGYTGAIETDSALKQGDFHAIPFLFGVRYSVPLVKKLHLVNAVGLGPMVGIGADDKARAYFGMELFMGLEYEVLNFLGLNFGIDSLIGARKNIASTVHTAQFGLRYYLPL